MNNKLTIFQYPKSLLEILLSFFWQIHWFSVFPEFQYFQSLICIYIIFPPCLLPLPQLPDSFLFFSLCCMKPSYAWHVESTKFSSVMIRLIRLIYDLRMLIWGQRGIIWSLKVLIWGMKGWFKSWWLMYISRGLIWCQGQRTADWKSERDNTRLQLAVFRPETWECWFKP